jgi:hypothetical protein
MTISKELTKATELLQAKMLVLQREEEKMLQLKTAFVNSTDDIKRDAAKPVLIAQAKKLKQAEAAADEADREFHRILAYEPDEVADLLDHKIHEYVIRRAVRRIIDEDIKNFTAPVSVNDEVLKFFDKNKKKLKSIADEDDWDEFYELAFTEFPGVDQDDVAQAMNNAAMSAGWFDNNIEDFRQNEDELEMMAFGTKAQQKGVDMADYNKKMKPVKQSPTELYINEGILTKETITEAEYRGRKVSLNRPFYTPGGPRKRAVYVMNDNGNVIKVGFGDPNMRIKKNIPARRKSFRARHKCDTAKDRTTARYWSCKAW